MCAKMAHSRNPPAMPVPPLSPTVSPPPPLPTERGGKVGIRKGYGDPQCAIVAQFWHSSGCPGPSQGGGNGTVFGEVIWIDVEA